MDLIHEKALDIAMHTPLPDVADKFVFFSNQRNRTAAANFCRKNPDYITVMHTDAQKALDALPLFGKESPFTIEEGVDISAVLSARFAHQAHGNVMVFCDKVSDRSTFFTIELPILLQNDKVGTINGVPKETWSGYVQAPVLPRTDLISRDQLTFQPG